MVYTSDINNPLYGKQMELVLFEYHSFHNFTKESDSYFNHKYKTDKDLRTLMDHKMDSGKVILPSLS